MASPLSLPASGQLRLDAQDWRLEGPLILRGSLEIIGAGLDPTRILGSFDGPLFRVVGRGRLILQDLSLERDGGWGGLVAVERGELRMVRCAVRGAVSWYEGPTPHPPLPPGADPQPGAVAILGGKARLEELVAERNGTGVGVGGSGRLTLQGGRVVANLSFGICVDQEGQLEAEGVSFSQNASGALRLGIGAPRAVARRCTFSSNPTGAVSLAERARFEASDCEFTGNPGNALTSHGHSELQLTRCRITDGEGTGLFVTGRATARLSENELRGNRGSGVVVAGLGTLELHRDRLEANGVNGLQAMGLSQVRLNSVSARLNTRRGLEGSDAASIDEQESCDCAENGEESRIAFGLARWSGAAPVRAACDTRALLSWLRAFLSNPNVYPEVREALLDSCAPSVSRGTQSQEVPAPLRRVFELATSERGELTRMGWPALEPLLWQHAHEPLVAEALAALELKEPTVEAAWVVRRVVPIAGAAVTALASGEGRLWAATAAGTVLAWNGERFTALAEAGAPVRSLAAGHGRLGLIAGDRALLLDATSGALLGTWAAEAGALGRAVPSGPDSLEVVVSDRSGHPTDRCTRVLRVRPGQSLGAGLQTAIAQGEDNIVLSPLAAYPWGEAGRRVRQPFDASCSIIAADEPPGWLAVTEEGKVKVVRPDGTVSVLDARPLEVGRACFLEGSRWLAALEHSMRVHLFDVATGRRLATREGLATSALAPMGGWLVIAEGDGQVRWLEPWIAARATGSGMRT